MSHVTGPRHGRSREAYPQGGAGGGLAAVVPLSRQRFIDGDTTQPGLNGAAGAPFKTIAQFTTARAPTSINDATANFVGWLMPAIAGYVGDVSLPAYATTELRADSFSLAFGTIITGDVNWVNQAGAFAAIAAIATIHNISISGTFTVTDDVNAPGSAVVFGGDELGTTVTIGGGFVAATTTKLTSAAFYNASVADIECGTASSSAIVFIDNCIIGGDIVAKQITAKNSQISVSTISTNAGEQSKFYNCTFSSATILTALGSAVFDGSSWSSFLEAGGTRAADTIVLVIGGYSGASVEGANLPDTGVNTNVSLNGTGASVGYTGSGSGNHYTCPTLNADGASVTMLVGGGEAEGDTMLITKTDTSAHALAVKNGAGTTIGTIPSGSRGFLLARFTAGQWAMSACGALAA